MFLVQNIGYENAVLHHRKDQRAERSVEERFTLQAGHVAMRGTETVGRLSRRSDETHR